MELDFYKCDKNVVDKYKIITVFPSFLVNDSEDLMIRGGTFYAVIDKNTGFWQTNERLVQKYVDEQLKIYAAGLRDKYPEYSISIKDMMTYKSKSWTEYKNYVTKMPDYFYQLDDRLCFKGETVTQKDYISKCLPYELKKGSIEAWDKIVSTLYDPEEREKIEWAIGAVITGDSKDIQKFLVFYGKPGAGKGTILNIIQQLFQGYYQVFDAKTLSNNNNAFAFEQFRTNPLVAIQMDGDLSRIQDNTKINSLVSHETIVMNEKRKQSYDFTPHCFLFMASNKPVDITDAKSGLLRRLIDVNPSGRKIPRREYDQLMGLIKFELGGIAWHCREVYRKLGKNRYNSYVPKQMMERTNAFYNFMEENYDEFQRLDLKEHGLSAQDAYSMWRTYCEMSGLDYKQLPINKFKDELREYFSSFESRPYINGQQKRNWYYGLIEDKFISGERGRKQILHDEPTSGLVLDQTESLLDTLLAECSAQYGEKTPDGGTKPKTAWTRNTDKLKDLDTKQLHFVRVPINHIVIDFDIKNEKGEKDRDLNIAAAEKFPPTYAEYSQGGNGIHLHYIYDGDPRELAGEYGKDIEIKVFTGKSSLRRRLSLCNNVPVAHISGSGLPKKEVKETVDFTVIKDEQHLINIINKCLRKEIEQPHTGPAMDLIKKTLDDAYAAGFSYDVSSLRKAINAFAAKSSHQRDRCMKIANELHYCSKDYEQTTPSTKITMKDIHTLEGLAQTKVEARPLPEYVDDSIVFFDIEVFPNLLLVNWKESGEGKGIVRMINPTRAEINELLHRKLVGFNCRRYDNHILYGRACRGYNNAQIYRQSQRIIGGDRDSMIGDAYNLSYTDIYDFAAKKQSLKKWEIELGIHHQELGLPWDQPVPENRWCEVAKYCDNDVIATEAVFNHLQGDFKARQILADIAGMTVNDTTNQLTTKIIFGDDPKPQAQFNYPDLAKKFPGYRFENGKSYYRHDIKIPKSEDFFGHVDSLMKVYGDRLVSMDEQKRIVTVDEEIGEGGRVYASPGVYRHVITFDVASMHPSSIIAENGFGKYTQLFKQLLDIRIAIKHRDFEAAKKMLDGKLAKYLDDPEQADALSQALKIAINSVYGLTAASFDNKFRDPRNKDNWVAKRGALFIETLRLKVMEMGGKVVHIKTDSIKVEEPTEEVKQFIMDYGKQWGYTFEVEDIYEKMCLVNDAVYIALRDREDPGWLKECRKAKKKAEESGQCYVEPTRWSATGAQFAHPYVFKTLFSKEPLDFKDLCETKTVTSALYLDFNENLSDVSAYEKDLEKLNKKLKDLIQKGIGLDMTVDEFARMFADDNPEKPEIPANKETLYIQAIDQLKDRKVLEDLIAEGHNYQFVGKAGSFCPVRAGTGGGILCRENNGKFSAATGSKGYRWREGESLEGADRMDLIDMGYFGALATAARNSVDEFAKRIGSSFEEFASEDDIPKKLPGSGEPEGKEQAPSFIDSGKVRGNIEQFLAKNHPKPTIDEVLERSDRMMENCRKLGMTVRPLKPEEVPPFDDEFIRKMEDELRNKVEGSKPSKVMIR